MRVRSWWLFGVLAACGAESVIIDTDPAQSTTQARLGTTHLRLMASNLTSGNSQSYDPRDGLRILSALKPDVAMMQEFNFGANTPADFRSLVDETFGQDYAYVRGVPAQIPNGIISRYPIVESGDWVDPAQLIPNRGFTWAHIDLPGPHDLWAVSVHLLTKNALFRQSEAQALVADLVAQVPANDWVVIGGDFNTSSREEPALATLGALVVTTGPWPVDQAGNGNTNASRKQPYDWVVVSPGLSAHQVPTVVGANSFANGLVVDTRVYSPLTDLAPATLSDSAAVNMQHMGVVRDFEVPTSEPVDAGVDAGVVAVDAGVDAGYQGVVSVVSPVGGEVFTLGQAVTISWSSSQVEQVEVDYASDGVHYTPVLSNVRASDGSVQWQVSGAPTQSARLRVRDVAGAASSESGSFTVQALPAHVIINEVLANEPGSNASGEFVELYNAGGSAADLSNWSLADSVSVRHRFAAGTVLAPGATLVIFGGKSGLPAGLTQALVSSTGGLSLSNTTDSVNLADAAGVLVDSMTYAAALASADGVSMNRANDRAGGGFVLHTTLSTLKASPGVSVTGGP